jgi:hypothetical protein
MSVYPYRAYTSEIELILNRRKKLEHIPRFKFVAGMSLFAFAEGQFKKAHCERYPARARQG